MTVAGRRGARIGILFGFTSWIVVLGILALCQGRGTMLVEVVAPLLFASLGLALLVLLAIEPLLAGNNEPLLAGKNEPLLAGNSEPPLASQIEPLLAGQDAAVPARPGHLIVVLGSVAFATGLLLLLADGFVAPALAADPEVARSVVRSGGVLALPRWLATGLLAAGTAALAVALRRAPPADGR